MPIPIETYLKTCQDWRKGDRNQRLGQFLMNNLCPHETNPSIFYEEHHRMASAKFISEYVNV